MKARACQTLDAHASELESLARQIFARPELGFKEHNTARLVHDWFDRLGLPHRDGIGITGTRADLKGGQQTGPTLAGHGADYRIDDYSRAVLNPAKALAMTAIDLLSDGAREGKRVVAEFKPKMSKQEYLAYQRRLTTTTLFRAEDLD